MIANVAQNIQRIAKKCNATLAVVQPVKQGKPKSTKPKADKQKYLISCKRKEFNLVVPVASSSKFGTIPLASKAWQHYKSKGDHFTIHPTVNEDHIRAEMQPIEEFMRSSNITISPELINNLSQQFAIDHLTAIQLKSLPVIYTSNHTLIAAETGCGKTIAYLLPIVQQIVQRKSAAKSSRRMNSPLAIILTPGRELATQIGGVAEKLGLGMDLKVKTILGGNTKRLMVEPEFEDVDILVASMGALSKLVTTGIYRMNEVRHVILDEADTLLDDSFAEKLCHFLKRFPFYKNHLQDEQIVGTQLILASATMPTNIEERLKRIVDVQTIREVVSANLHMLMPHIEQRFLRMNKSDRPVHLLRIAKMEQAKGRPLIVFGNKSVTSDYISIFLNDNGVNCLNLNGDMLMKIRLGRFEQFQRGECNVLATTDVGSRGLDTSQARHVVNFDFPMHVSDYIHRCGRIGRVNSLQNGLVTNFVSSLRELDLVRRIEHTARTAVVLPNVNANIKQLIHQRIMKDMQMAGVETPEPSTGAQEEAF